jgi:hypothetical protein
LTYQRQTRCIDCIAEGRRTARAAPRPGPRCLEHHREVKRRRSALAHANMLVEVYGITSEQYRAIYEYQQRHCAICQRSTGARKRLAVDHDHHKGCGHDPKLGCRNCVRALLCGPCNELLGRFDVAALKRAIHVLEDPPARRVLGGK